MEESKYLQFKSLIHEKVDPHTNILGQPNRQDINRLCYKISHYDARIQKDTNHSFQASLIDRHASCHPITQSLGKIQKIRINGSDPPLHQHQEEFKAFNTNSTLPTFLLQAPTSKRAGGRL